jgi:hypothetical protein
MNKSTSIIFIAFILLLSVESKMKSKFFWDNCYRYGIQQNGIANAINQNVKVFNNLKDKSKAQIAYYQKKDVCDVNCKKSSEYYSCIESGYDYDKAFEIPDNVYVCWLQATCDNTDKVLFKNKDINISFSGEKGCNYLCRAVYGNANGMCLSENNRYQCYYR